MNDTTLEYISFDSGKAGKHLLVLGAIHGDEKCGTAAIRRAVADFESGKLKIEAGKISFIPICNPRAYAENVRFIERNLNRYLFPKDEKVHYEDHLDTQICAALDEADILLDLHSYESAGGPFIFLGQSGNENEFALSIGINDFVCGWSEAFSKSSAKGAKESIGTTEYMRAKGGMGITLECGQHLNADAPEVGYQAIVNALGFIHGKKSDSHHDNIRCVKMQKVFYKEKEGKTTKHWEHYDRVHAGEVIARYDDGEEIIAPEDGYIVLPKAKPRMGGEWFYFGIGIDFPKH